MTENATMKRLQATTIAALALTAGLHGGLAQAARALDVPPPTPAAVLNAPKPDTATQADDRSSLRQGVVRDVSADRAWVYVNGTWLRIAEGSTQLFRQGRAVHASALSKGQLLRFTLAPGAADRTTLGVVYVP
ncbi:MAG: hypothetical protein AD742_08460 [Methylibium sp. NZG]|nr:MAG: hypothetical protein AD742_08460 [Methylibium sp. NZG]